MKAYQPINCGVYDQLLVWASQKVEVTITHQKDDTIQSEKGIINDVYTKDKAEYLKLNTGTTIRLDFIHTINTIDLSGEENCRIS